MKGLFGSYLDLVNVIGKHVLKLLVGQVALSEKYFVRCIRLLIGLAIVMLLIYALLDAIFYWNYVVADNALSILFFGTIFLEVLRVVIDRFN